MSVLIAIPGNEAHAARLGERLGVEVLVPEVRHFPDGEMYVRLPREAIAGDVAIVGNLEANSFLQVAFLAGTARDLGAVRVGLVAPYLAYMRQDACFNAGEGVTARYFARLVSSTVDWLVTVDPHLHRLDSLDRVYSIPTTIARAAPAIARWIADEVRDPVLVGPDAESAQWVSAVADRLGAPYVILEKTRRGDRDVSVAWAGAGPAAPPQLDGHTPVLIDDIVSTGRTMLEATRRLRAAGTAAPMCIAIHAVFADAVGDELVAAGASGIITCDTIAHASNRICVADPIADAVRSRL
ncbi:MAG: ribose-phosphate diphosphokinase [Deltaproteobacteria bacterium]|nr:ribose-phosphate diphosphokinase [Deltaproteobacteria bacterium]MCW5801019.1 ribose-phosphate diphosphokinase [Deltaproteobacteria bacterium]